MLAGVTFDFAKRRVAELFPGDNTVPAAKPVLPAIVQTTTNALCTHVLDAAKTIKVIRGSRAREEVSGHLSPSRSLITRHSTRPAAPLLAPCQVYWCGGCGRGVQPSRCDGHRGKQDWHARHTQRAGASEATLDFSRYLMFRTPIDAACRHRSDAGSMGRMRPL